MTVTPLKWVFRLDISKDNAKLLLLATSLLKLINIIDMIKYNNETSFFRYPSLIRRV